MEETPICLSALGRWSCAGNILSHCYAWRGVTQRLPCVSDGFGMHVFVKERELKKICFVVSVHLGCGVGCRLFDHTVENPLHIADRFGLCGQRQIPARVMR